MASPSSDLTSFPAGSLRRRPLDESSATVLLVDDEPVVCRSIARCLERSGYRVVVAGSGPEALATLERQGVDLVLTDMGMPGMNGGHLVGMILERHPHLRNRIILATGNTATDQISELVARTSCRLLAKPYPLNDLLDALHSALAAA
jgi:CheY-like chemotaxis protein